jgi:hypothetical protein
MQLLSLLLFAIRVGFFSGCMMILWVSSLIVVPACWLFTDCLKQVFNGLFLSFFPFLVLA